jgi:hypothetical protein
MIRKFKVLGLALVAVLALAAVAASTASAAGKYTAEVENTTGTGESALGNDTFTTEAGNVECKSHFEGTVPGFSASNLTVKAKYTECKAFGFATANVNMGSCDYLFTTPTKVTTAGEPPVTHSHQWTIPVHVKCGATPISITAGNCEITVGEQSPGGHVIATVTTNAVPVDVDVQATITGIKYTIVKDGFLCPFDTTKTGVPSVREGATYTQHKEITFKSTNGSGIHIG